MSKINNSEFLILTKAKRYYVEIDKLVENVPKRDFFDKDTLKRETLNLLDIILSINYCEQKIELINLKMLILKTISKIDIFLEILYSKKYINSKSLEKFSIKLVEINNMSNSWIRNKVNEL